MPPPARSPAHATQGSSATAPSRRCRRRLHPPPQRCHRPARCRPAVCCAPLQLLLHHEAVVHALPRHELRVRAHLHQAAGNHHPDPVCALDLHAVSASVSASVSTKSALASKGPLQRQGAACSPALLRAAPRCSAPLRAAPSRSALPRRRPRPSPAHLQRTQSARRASVARAAAPSRRAGPRWWDW